MPRDPLYKSQSFYRATLRHSADNFIFLGCHVFKKAFIPWKQRVNLLLRYKSNAIPVRGHRGLYVCMFLVKYENHLHIKK
jgi:hypothetical protein